MTFGIGLVVNGASPKPIRLLNTALPQATIVVLMNTIQILPVPYLAAE
jgi:hypothetical protein